MLFPNNNTALCQAKELCWPQGQGPPLSPAGRARELHADAKLLAWEGAEEVFGCQGAGGGSGGAQTEQAPSSPQPQGAIVREHGQRQGQRANVVATRAPSLEFISRAAVHGCPV